jgi:hypothetical protein
MVYPTQVWQVVVTFGQSQIKSGSLECGCAFEIVFFVFLVLALMATLKSEIWWSHIEVKELNL